MRGPTVGSVMTPDVITVRAQTPFKDIVRILDSNQISAVPVIDPAGTPVGVVSEADLLAKEEYAGGTTPVRMFAGHGRRQRWRKAHGLTATDLMTTPISTIGTDEPVVAAARRMIEANIRRLFVTEPDGKLAGVLARRDILRLFLRSDNEIRDDVVREVLAKALWADPHMVHAEVDQGVVTLSGRLERRSETEIAVKLTATRPGVVNVVDQLDFDWDDVTANKTAGL